MTGAAYADLDNVKVQVTAPANILERLTPESLENNTL
jgi:hypothetical protein